MIDKQTTPQDLAEEEVVVRVPKPHPSVTEIVRWFECDHLDDELKAIVHPYKMLANDLAYGIRGECIGPELTVALRKLLESKDAAVRARIAARGA